VADEMDRICGMRKRKQKSYKVLIRKPEGREPFGINRHR
jgi:hypothetical protein